MALVFGGLTPSDPVSGLDPRDPSTRELAELEDALARDTHMVRWGVADPAHDPRSQVAYDLAMRRAHVAAL